MWDVGGWRWDVGGGRSNMSGANMSGACPRTYLLDGAAAKDVFAQVVDYRLSWGYGALGIIELQ